MTSDLIFLGLLVFIAGFIDAIAGGGGLITIPGYMNYGLSEHLLLGTNKFSSSMGTLVATARYLKEIRFEKKIILTIFLSSTVFSFLGAYFISHIHEIIVRKIIYFIIPSLSFYFVLSSNFGISKLSDKPIKYSALKSILVSSSVSFYDGMMGPGTGTFLTLGYFKIVGYDIIKSTALAKYTNLMSNISALITFISLKKVDFKLGLYMGFVSIIGNYIGSTLALRKGLWIIKPFLFFISNLMIIKIVLEQLKLK